MAICLVALMIGEGSALQWLNLVPQAEALEDLLMPLIPLLWLFLFVVELERTDRERLEATLARMMAVHGLAAKITVTMEPAAIMDEVVEAAARLLDAAFAAVLTPDDPPKSGPVPGESGPVPGVGKELAVRAYRGISADEAAAVRIPVGVGISGRAFADGRWHQTNGTDEMLAPTMAPVAKRHGIIRAVSVPLVFRGAPIGLLNVGRKSAEPFSDNEILLLETLSAHAAVAIENARLYERLSESEARFRLIVENAQVPIAVVNADRQVIFWNSGMEQLFGWTAGEMAGQHISRVYSPEDMEDVERVILPSLERTANWFGEFPLVRKDGSHFTGFMSLARVIDAAGRVVCTLGIILDVTERVQLRDQLFQAQKMQTVGTLAGGVAHDFNNLLTAILGFTDLLKTSLQAGSDNLDSVVNIENAARRGTQLVKQLLAFSHKQPVKAEPVNLSDVANETCDLIERTFPRTIEVVRVLAPGLHTIRGDSTQMHQVIMNLAVNARDAMPRGGTLTVSTENIDLAADDPRGAGLAPGPCILLSVADTGQGIPPDVQPHVFEPFFTTKPAGGGTGLGLSTVYAIVMRHGGRVTFKSQVGRGTTFSVILPALHYKPAPLTAPVEPQPTEVR
jgi:hypothetical protein